MFSFLLLIVYIIFISLGLPDGILGSAWPSMYEGLNVNISMVGIITLIIPLCTIISSLFCDRLTKKFGTGKITLVSVLLTALALFGFSLSTEFWMLCLFAIPYGLGAGCVDASINNYAAVHYSSKHMSWLHCMWGIGASVGPYIMGMTLSSGNTWNLGYRIISIIQCILVAVLFFALPLWKESKEEKEEIKVLSFKQVISIKGVIPLVICFFAYSAVEQTTILWAGSYLTLYCNMAEEIAASFSSMFLMGLTFGRFVSGFISVKLNDKKMIRLGQLIILVGILILMLPFGVISTLIGFVLIGLGCAPIYPSIMHSIPILFGKEKSQSLVGIQMAFAYTGTLLMPALFGIIVEYVSIGLLSIYLLVFLILMIVLHELTHKLVKKM